MHRRRPSPTLQQRREQARSSKFGCQSDLTVSNDGVEGTKLKVADERREQAATGRARRSPQCVALGRVSLRKEPGRRGAYADRVGNARCMGAADTAAGEVDRCSERAHKGRPLYCISSRARRPRRRGRKLTRVVRRIDVTRRLRLYVLQATVVHVATYRGTMQYCTCTRQR